MYRIYTKKWGVPPGYAYKISLVMRLTTVILIASLMQVSAASLAQRISLSRSNASLKNIIKELRQQSGYDFIYTDNLLRQAKPVSVDVQNMALEEVLIRIFKEQPLTFSMDNKTVVVKPKAASLLDKIATVVGSIGKEIIRGLVKDQEGKPLPNASIQVKGKPGVYKSNENGEFSIPDVAGDAILVFSYIGYKSKEINVAELKRNPQVILAEKTNELSETVVVGYGSQKRRDITGSIATIDQKDLEKRTLGSASFDRALGGLAKGVLVGENTGELGAPASINIRGFTSPFSGGSNQPLFVIDGIILNTDAQYDTGGETMFTHQNNPLLAMDPGNIESISILKDAAATAIYGSRGANGVIIVTTKKGRRGEKARVSMSYANTIGSPISRLETMNTQQFMAFNDLLLKNTVASVNKGESPASRLTNYRGTGMANITQDPVTKKYSYNGLIPGYFGNANTDWFKEIYRDNANTHQANLNIRGGSDYTTYSLTGSYYDQQGLMLNSSLKQYSFGLNLNSDLSKYFSTGVSVNLNTNTNKSGNNSSNDVRARFYLFARPDLPVYDEQGLFLRQPNLVSGPGNYKANPVASLQYQNSYKGYNLAGNAFIAAEPLKGLKFKAAFNTGVFLTKSDEFSPQVVQNISPFSPLRESSLSVSDALMSNYITDLSATYDLKLDEKQQFNFTGGYIWDRTTVKRTYNFYQGFPDDEILNNVNNARSALAYGGGSIESGLNSIFGRVNYNFADRYLATLNFRSDASSKFGPGNKRGYFPSLSFGWNIHNENFFDKSGTIERLKLRLSAGKTGSSNIGDFAYFQFFEKGFRDLGQYDGGPAVEFSSTLPNPKISWETTYDYNAGLDFDLKDRRVYGSIDVYYRNTPNSIAATPFSVELGPQSFSSNLVNMSNKGLELELGADILRPEEGLKWSVNLNWSLNRNRIKSLNNATIDPFFQDAFVVGQPIGTIKGYKTAGIFQTQAEVDALNAAAVAKYGAGSYYDLRGTAPGDYKLVDVNGDGKITVDDRVVLGNIEPDYFGGFGNTFSYKGFELTAFFQFVKGIEASWNNATPSTTPLDNNLAIFAGSTWTEQNTGAKYPRVVSGNPGQNTRANDQLVFDASYLRLKTLYLNYTFGKKVTERLRLANLSVFVSAANLFTVSNWPGTDPATLYSGSATGRRENRDPYPLAKSVSLGLNVQF